ncbi:hypothetical protein QBC38DRAFT_250460 [Podospora fimiseda]|uniref:Uncharacterized protein n=1 Tax=Podospora fimiseda TaxID=252190 RepID=A0AAN7BM95_9PEZI|nr:hypothetical protein QBC38DRAFT_250460 [Podospora fimiseda]
MQPRHKGSTSVMGKPPILDRSNRKPIGLHGNIKSNIDNVYVPQKQRHGQHHLHSGTIYPVDRQLCFEAPFTSLNVVAYAASPSLMEELENKRSQHLCSHTFSRLKRRQGSLRYFSTTPNRNKRRVDAIPSHLFPLLKIFATLNRPVQSLGTCVCVISRRFVCVYLAHQGTKKNKQAPVDSEPRRSRAPRNRAVPLSKSKTHQTNNRIRPIKAQQA